VLLAPAYDRNRADGPPNPLPEEGAPITVQSRNDFMTNWDRQIGCESQIDPLARDAVWREMMASDPVGATWGSGVRRAPRTTVWGFNRATAARMRTPMLIAQGIHDAQVTPDRARDLYTDLGSASKVFIDLGCASHNAMWERKHGLLFRASLEWLQNGTVNGIENGVLQMGYE
jgi:pimeloyl-ACP methyl ester carboxylesterase